MAFGGKIKKQVLLENVYGDINASTCVWRIFSARYLLEDVKSNAITLVMPCYETQKDILENPLRDSLSTIDGQKYKLFLNMMSSYYTLSWSLRNDIEWNYFSTLGDKIRVKCKAYTLFDRLMNICDRYYMHNYHMGKIEYRNAHLIKKRYLDNDYESFLESSGLSLVESIMILQDKFTREAEVRLLYDYQPQCDNKFPLMHRIHGNINQYCSHTFDWQDVIEEYEFDPSNRDNHIELEKWLKAYGAKKVKKRSWFPWFS